MITELLGGIAGVLGTAGVGVYDPTRIWTSADTATAIVVRDLPQDPPKVVSVSAYHVQADPVFNDSTVAVQIRLRGDRQPTLQDDVLDTIVGALNGLHDTTVGGVPVVLSSWQSTIPGPLDENQRWQTTVNFYLRVTDPGAYRTE